MSQYAWHRVKSTSYLFCHLLVVWLWKRQLIPTCINFYEDNVSDIQPSSQDACLPPEGAMAQPPPPAPEPSFPLGWTLGDSGVVQGPHWGRPLEAWVEVNFSPLSYQVTLGSEPVDGICLFVFQIICKWR